MLTGDLKPATTSATVLSNIQSSGCRYLAISGGATHSPPSRSGQPFSIHSCENGQFRARVFLCDHSPGLTEYPQPPSRPLRTKLRCVAWRQTYVSAHTSKALKQSVY